MTLFTKIVLIYFLIINLVALLLMGIDKLRAKKNGWRIPEKTLFILVLIGGGIGGTIGMFAFHHKTKHWYFRIFFPLIPVLEIALYIFLKVKHII